MHNLETSCTWGVHIQRWKKWWLWVIFRVNYLLYYLLKLSSFQRLKVFFVRIAKYMAVNPHISPFQKKVIRREELTNWKVYNFNFFAWAKNYLRIANARHASIFNRPLLEILYMEIFTVFLIKFFSKISSLAVMPFILMSYFSFRVKWNGLKENGKKSKDCKSLVWIKSVEFARCH